MKFWRWPVNMCPVTSQIFQPGVTSSNNQTSCEVLSVPPIFHMDSSGLQWTLSTAKSTYISHDWSRVEWSGVHWSPLDCPVHLESIWTFTTLESYWSGLDSTGFRGIFSLCLFNIMGKKKTSPRIEPLTSSVNHNNTIQ